MLSENQHSTFDGHEVINMYECVKSYWKTSYNELMLNAVKLVPKRTNKTGSSMWNYRVKMYEQL